MNRNTHQKDFYHTNHRKYPRWGHLAKTKDYRRCPWGRFHWHSRDQKDPDFDKPHRVLVAEYFMKGG